MKKSEDVVKYLCREAFNPVQSKWIKSIRKGFSTTWPGLTEEVVRKYSPKQVPTNKITLKTTMTEYKRNKPKKNYNRTKN